MIRRGSGLEEIFRSQGREIIHGGLASCYILGVGVIMEARACGPFQSRDELEFESQQVENQEYQVSLRFHDLFASYQK